MLLPQRLFAHTSACFSDHCYRFERGAVRTLHQMLPARHSGYHYPVEKYQPVLGAKGLEAFRKRAEMEWTRAPELTGEPGYRDENRSWLTSIMESLAKRLGA